MLPTELSAFRRNLLKWYDMNMRDLPWRRTQVPFFIFVSEVMLQQTRVDTVIAYYERFIDRFPDVLTLSNATQEEVLKSWEGLGYYSRARNLHRTAKILVDEYNGQFPSELALARKLPGVGKYIAAAFLSIAFNIPTAAVDGNVKRVISRLFRKNACVNDAGSEEIFSTEASILLDPERPGDFNQAMMELGAVICTPKKPRCDICPVFGHCEAGRHGLEDSYPKRKKRAAVPTYEIAVGVVKRREKILITKRQDKGLLGGLWEFPGGKLKEGESPRQACARELLEEIGLRVSVGAHVTTIRHAYTHFKIVMYVFRCKSENGTVVLNGPKDFKWIRPEELPHYPLPAANLKFINMIT